MINLQDIRYVRLGTRDLEGAVDYATKILGLQLVGREGKSAYFRSDTVPVRVTLRPFAGAEYVETVPVKIPHAARGQAVHIEAASGVMARPDRLIASSGNVPAIGPSRGSTNRPLT